MSELNSLSVSMAFIRIQVCEVAPNQFPSDHTELEMFVLVSVAKLVYDLLTVTNARKLTLGLCFLFSLHPSRMC